jgi:hypothetical protein
MGLTAAIAAATAAMAESSVAVAGLKIPQMLETAVTLAAEEGVLLTTAYLDMAEMAASAAELEVEAEPFSATRRAREASAAVGAERSVMRPAAETGRLVEMVEREASVTSI